jgi:F0F1-type ATP synthase assembly protein I
MAADQQRNDAWSGMGTGWAITSTMIGGILVWGGLGLLVDRLLGTARVFMAIGMVLGAGGAVYLVYLRYGRGEGGGRT